MDRGAQKRRQSALKINLKSTDGLYMTTVNPCNDFLVDFLIASKLKSEKQGIGKFTTYNLAIQSVRKYPLPIICEAQLAALQGFGDFFINQAAKRIQKHYKRGRIPTPQEMEQDDKEHFDALQANRRKGYKRKKVNGEQQDENSESFQGSQEQKEGSLSQSNMVSKKTVIQSAKSIAKKEKNKLNYKPRPQTQPQKILKAMYVLKQREKDKSKQKDKAYSKGQINQIFFNWTKDSVKSWQFCRNRLRQSGYIDSDKQEKDLVRLTQKGYNFIAKRMGRSTDKNEQNNKEGQKIQKKKIQQYEGIYKLKYCQDIEQLTIIVNQKKINISQKFQQQKITQQQRQQILQIFQQICQQNQHKVDFQDMQASSYCWQIEGQILEYAVIRVVRNLLDFSKDRIMMNCYYAKLADFTHITVIFEKQSQQDSQQQFQKNINPLKDEYNQKQFNEIIIFCRAAGYKIIQTNNYKQTIQYISQMTKLIKNKLNHIKQQVIGITVIGCVQNINKKVNKKKMLATLYSRCLRFLINNKDAALQMTLKFGTFKNTEAKIIKKGDDDTMQSKKKVLRTLFKNCGDQVSDQNIKKIVKFFFSQSYQ